MVLQLQGFIRLLSLGFGCVYPEVGLTFVSIDLNKAAILFSHFKICNAENKE